MKLLGNGNALTTIAIGAGVVLLAPAAIGIVGSILRPVTKAAIKGGMIAYNTARGAIAETAETLGDLTAEARAELSQE
jgi:hypothetical protein